MDSTAQLCRKSSIGLLVVALLLLSQQWFIRLIDARFLYEVDLSIAPIFAFVLSQMLAGLVFLSLLFFLPRVRVSPFTIGFVITVGLLLRLCLFGSTPILEVDFYRYLWDGAVTASGFNPWLLSPADMTQSTELNLLAKDAGIVSERINYSELRSIYPPLAQLFFALAYLVDSWNLDGWRFVLLVADCTTLLILLRLLMQVKRSPLWSAIYWWNPLVIHETFNTLHMDVLLLPFLLAAILFICQRRFILSSCFLALAAGIKLWPLLLLPFALRPLLGNPRKLGLALVSIAAILLIVVGPLLFFGSGEDSGLQAYAQNWLRNSALFPLLNSLTAWLFDDSSGLIARLLVAGLLSLWVVYLNRNEISDNDQLLSNICWVIAALFLLSPTQFPWYTIWFAPLLCFYPKPALLLLSALMPVYYLRFYWSLNGNVDTFDNLVIWIQYLPVYFLLLWPWLSRRFSSRMISSYG